MPARSAASYIAACRSAAPPPPPRSSARIARAHSEPTQGQLRSARAYTASITAGIFSVRSR
jgi:hypothetical protein